MRVVLAALIAGGALALTGCGNGGTTRVTSTVENPYAGPLDVRPDYADEAGVLARSGSAGRALECTGKPWNGGGADYDSGLASAQATPEQALRNKFEKDSPGRQVPDDGYVVERADAHQVLFSYDVGGRTKAAFVVTDDVEDFDHHRGWGVLTWAECDLDELPARYADAAGYQLWNDRSGARAPVGEIRSYPAPDYHGVTMLTVGSDDQSIPWREQPLPYVRDPQRQLDLPSIAPFDAHATLPADARDTGYRRDGRALWVAPGAAYLVSLTDRHDVERWPQATEQLAFG